MILLFQFGRICGGYHFGRISYIWLTPKIPKRSYISSSWYLWMMKGKVDGFRHIGHQSRGHWVPLTLSIPVNPQSLTWNLKMLVSKWNLIFQVPIFRFHIELQGCIAGGYTVESCSPRPVVSCPHCLEWAADFRPARPACFFFRRWRKGRNGSQHLPQHTSITYHIYFNHFNQIVNYRFIQILDSLKRRKIR